MISQHGSEGSFSDSKTNYVNNFGGLKLPELYEDYVLKRSHLIRAKAEELQIFEI